MLDEAAQQEQALTVPESIVRLELGAGGRPRLHDHGAERKTRGHDVAYREAPFCARLVRHELRDARARCSDRTRQATILLWVDPVDAGAEHGDSPSTGVERRGVRGSIDAGSET